MKRYTLCKIYNDGSHYVAMPYKRDPFEEIDPSHKKPVNRVNYNDFAEIDLDSASLSDKISHAYYLFERDYNYSMTLSKSERMDFFAEELAFAFPEREKCDRFVQTNLNRRFKNFVYRKLRLLRKIALLKFDYFCTFTYDGSKMDETEFRKKFSYYLQNKATRSNWKYIGVWERSPDKNRLHFHCLLKAEENTIPGEFTKKRIWSSKVKRMRSVLENDYIRTRFGVNDFSPIDYEDPEDYTGCIDYLLKYIEKSGEKLVYSRGLYQYLVANIDDEDVVFTQYKPCLKMVLYDDFKTYSNTGELIGVCSKETLAKLRRSNK